MRHRFIFIAILFLTACSTPAPVPAGSDTVSSSDAVVSSVASSAVSSIADPALAARVEAAYQACVTRTMAEAKQQNKDVPADVFDPVNRQLAEGACGIMREACARGADDPVCAGLLAEYE